MASYDYSKKGNTVYYNKILRSGSFAKLPCPEFVSEFHRLYNCFPVPLDIFISFSLFLFFVSFYSFSPEFYSYSLSSYEELYRKSCSAVGYLGSAVNLGKMEHTVFPSLCSGKSSVTCPEPICKMRKEGSKKKLCIYTGTLCESQGDESDSRNPAFKELSSYIYKIDMPAHLCEGQEKEHKNNRNEKSKYNSKDTYYEAIKNETDSLIRGKKALKYFMYQCIEEGKQYPTIDEFRQDYRNSFGTGKENQGDVIRLNKTYKKYFNIFKGEIENSIESKLSFLESKVREALSEEEIQQIQNTKSSYDRKIYYEDIAAAGLWIYSSLVNQEYRQLRQFSGKQETVPMVGMKEYLSKLKEMKIIKNKCNHQKAKALRVILEEIGWIRIVESSYSFQKHIAMRYILEWSHPYYQAYENIVGKDIVQGWRDYQESSQNKDNRKSAS